METKKPLLVVFAGPNGSGKSTITDTFGNLKGYTNADEVVKYTHMKIFLLSRYCHPTTT